MINVSETELYLECRMLEYFSDVRGTLLFRLVVTIVLYLVLGIVINRYLRNKQGTDLIPNVGFWADLLPLVKVSEIRLN